MIFTSLLCAVMIFSFIYGLIPLWAAVSASVVLGAGVYFFGRNGHDHGAAGISHIDALAAASGLAGVSPGLKTGFFVLVLIGSICADSLIFSVFVIVTMAAATVLLGKVRFHEYFHLLMTPFVFIILSGIAMLFDISSAPGGALCVPVFSRWLVVTSSSRRETLAVILKASAAISCLYALNLSTPIYEIIDVLRKIKVPELMIELMFLIYRYIFVFIGTADAMKTAAETRLGFRPRSVIRTSGGIMLGLFIVSFRRAQASFDAMESRCYNGSLRFLHGEKSLAPRHLAVCALYTVFLAAIYTTERIIAG